VLLAVAGLLLCCGGWLAGAGLYFRARSSRVEGVVVDQDRRGRPVVEYRWGGQLYHHQQTGPSNALAVGTAVGVYVPPEGPSWSRLDNPTAQWFLPAWFCLMPAAFFAAYGAWVAARR
jgi:hypothetical protein